MSATESGARFKEYRLHYNKTQRQVAEQTGLSVFTVNQLRERQRGGNIACERTEALRTVEALEDIEKVLPPLPVSPMRLYKLQGKKRKRASKKPLPSRSGSENKIA